MKSILPAPFLCHNQRNLTTGNHAHANGKGIHIGKTTDFCSQTAPNDFRKDSYDQ